ncbi:MobC family plasmid mobilization relaxosome protein [Zafaria sp. Z1313]|uniref:MobC family plasmid mobilization relaxosome protein n=1 Tax=unclassified Zafaria TaxID=2828765 RepID=UPI003D3029E1
MVEVDGGAVAELKEGLQKVAERYTRQAFQLQKIGNNVNQIAKVANARGEVDADAVRSVERAIDRLSGAMEQDAKRDSAVSMKLGEVL